jgi:hypothetical protein
MYSFWPFPSCTSPPSYNTTKVKKEEEKKKKKAIAAFDDTITATTAFLPVPSVVTSYVIVGAIFVALRSLPTQTEKKQDTMEIQAFVQEHDVMADKSTSNTIKRFWSTTISYLYSCSSTIWQQRTNT